MEWWQLQELLITIAVIAAVLVPVFALTYRFLGKGSLRDRDRFSGEKADSAGALKDERLDHMERQLEDLEGLVRRLVEASEFDRQLKSGQPSEAED